MLVELFSWVLMAFVISFWVVAFLVAIWGVFFTGSELFRCVKRLFTFTSVDVSSNAPPDGMAHTTLPLVVKIKPRAKVMRVVARQVHR